MRARFLPHFFVALCCWPLVAGSVEASPSPEPSASEHTLVSSATSPSAIHHPNAISHFEDLLDKGSTDEAIGFAKEQVAAANMTNDSEDGETLAWRARLGKAFNLGHRFEDAAAELTEVLPRLTEVLGATHPETFFATIELADAYYELGRYEESKALVVQALEREVTGGRKAQEQRAYALTLIGWNEFHLGNYGSLVDVAARAQEASIALYGRTSIKTANVFRLYARGLMLRGDCLEADRQFEAFIATFDAMENARPQDKAAFLNSAASAKLCLGDSFGALQYYAEATRLMEQAHGRDHLAVARIKMNYASLTQDVGQRRKAEVLYKEILPVLETAIGTEHPTYAMASHNYGNLLQDLGRHGDALPFLQHAVRIMADAFGADHPYTAQVAFSLGGTLVALGSKEEGLTMARDALRVLQKYHGPGHMNMAEAYLAMAQALPMVEGSFEAMEFSLKALEVTRDTALLSFQTLPENRKVQWIASQRSVVDLPLTLLAEEQPSTDEQRRQVWEDVLFFKNLTLRLLAGQQGAIEALDNPELLARYRQMLRDKERYARFTYQPPQGLSEEEVDRELLELNERIQSAEEALSRASVAYLAQQRTLSTSLDEILKALPEGTVLIDYYRFGNQRLPSRPERYGAFVGTREEVWFVDLGAGDTLDDQIEFVRQSLDVTKPNLFDAAQHGLSKLDQRLIRPLDLPAGTESLVIVPDGALHLVPFDSLYSDQGWLIDRVDLRLVSNAADLAVRLPQKTSDEARDRILAAPAFDGPVSLQERLLEGLATSAEALLAESLSLAGLRHMGCDAAAVLPALEALPGARKEGRSVKRHLQRSNRVDLLLGSDATVAAVLESQRPRVLHLATHGFFLDGCEGVEQDINPLLLSGLAFTGANRSDEIEEAAFFTAYQASQLDLRNTALVVLSACDTGAGVMKADGLYGLRRSFEHAGAGTVVSSLWPVPDRETAELMEAYYARLAKGMGTVTALQEAKREIRRKVRKRYGTEHPGFWAGFVAVGHDQPLPGLAATDNWVSR